ncbi:MAG: DNA polymerase III subunit delta [Myxococcales bacterium]|nr:DNA polymerase III subunit delta [Myxococcales bacterium]
MSDLDKALKGGSAQLYLLHGDAALLTREAGEWLRQRVLDGAIEDFNLDRFDGGDRLDAEAIAQAARTLPMMAARRMVWVRNAEGLLNQAKGNLGPLLKYVAAPDATTCLVFQANEKVKRTGALVKALEKDGCVLESRAPRDRELPRWVEERARLRGRRIESAAAALLVDAIGADLASLDGAVERLTLYVEGKGTIQAAHVEETVPHTRARTVWELTDAVADREPAKALGLAHLLLSQGEQPLRLLGVVNRQFRQLLIGHGARAAGASLQDAATQAGVPPFRVTAFARQVDRYQSRDLLVALDRLARADQDLKGSKLPGALIFEALLLDLCAA